MEKSIQKRSSTALLRLSQRIRALIIKRQVFLDAVGDHLVQPLFGPFAHAASVFSSTCRDSRRGSSRSRVRRKQWIWGETSISGGLFSCGSFGSHLFACRSRQ